MKSTTDLKGIAMAGGGLSIDASKKSTTDLKGIAMLLKPEATLILKNCQGKSTTDLKGIAMVCTGKIIFDFE